LKWPKQCESHGVRAIGTVKFVKGRPV